MLVDDLGADPWTDGESIAFAMEDRFDMNVADDHALRDPTHILSLRVRDLIALVENKAFVIAMD